jgi:hypothetical protein
VPDKRSGFLSGYRISEDSLNFGNLTIKALG